MRWNNLVFLAALLQALETGTFLTLDVATHSLQTKWGFDGDEIVQVGTIGYSIGFAGVACFCFLLTGRINSRWMILIGTVETTCGWAFILIWLCYNCLTWYQAALLEAMIGMGTALAYTGSVQLVVAHNSMGDSRKWKILALSLSVSIGSVIAFFAFIFIPSVTNTIILMMVFSIISGSLLFAVTFIPVMVSDQGNGSVEVKVQIGHRITWNFAAYLLAVNISFGVIVTMINNGSNMIKSTGIHWNPQTPLLCLTFGNLIGRCCGFFMKDYLPKVLWLFAGFSFLHGISQFILIADWHLPAMFFTMIIGTVFFGLIWSLTMPMAKEFFHIAEDHSLGNVFCGMAIGPLLFGPYSAWVYDRHQVFYNCDSSCFIPYVISAGLQSILAAAGYMVAWYLQTRYPPIHIE